MTTPDKPAGEALTIPEGTQLLSEFLDEFERDLRTPPPSALDDEIEAVLTELADDLETEVRARWGDDARLSHKLERDLSPVTKARALLTRIKERSNDRG